MLLSNNEIISLHIGQAGCQVGVFCWEMYCLEHNIRADGIECSRVPKSCPLSFFSESGSSKVVPRASFIDLEPTVVDDIRVGPFRGLFKPRLLISGKEDASNCFARGYFTVGAEILELSLEQIRTMMEECNKPQGFITFRSFGGGTGSGFVAALLERLNADYPKCDVFEFCIFPSPRLSTVVVEPYNVALTIHRSQEFSNALFLMDNEALYDICDRMLDVYDPSYFNINRLISQIVSAVTVSLRFEGTVNVSLNDIKTNLIPFPRIKYPIISYAPLISKKQILYENLTASSLVNSCFEPSNQMVKCDVKKGKYMTCAILFRGDLSNASINSSIASLKAKHSVNFVDWIPTEFKVGLNNMPPIAIPGGDLPVLNQSCVMLANSTAIKSAWSKINQKFDLMFSKKAFLHWYLMEGLEEADFQDTRLDLGALEQDYAEAEAPSK